MAGMCLQMKLNIRDIKVHLRVLNFFRYIQ